MAEKLSINEIILILYSNDKILNDCIKSFTERHGRTPNQEEILGAILARIPMEQYSPEEQRNLEQRITLYLCNTLDDEDDGIEFNYPPGTPPFEPDITGGKKYR